MTDQRSISLNTDIGEGFGDWRIADDDALLDIVTDANVGCGFHAGDPDIMRRTCDIAAARSISIGAQVGFYDLRGFGRRFIEIPPESLTNDVIYQFGALQAFAMAAGATVAYVKAHGALYHAAVAHPDYATAVIRAIMAINPSLPLMCQPGTPFAKAAQEAGLRTIAEGYIDRAYLPTGLLVPRGSEGAMITDLNESCRRAVQLAAEGTVIANDGATIAMPVDSMCIHSDSAGAVQIASAVRAAIENAGLTVAPLHAS
ncbi:MAG: 5-oxoprolinase subunit PxpA [Antricoccus sp.]